MALSISKTGKKIGRPATDATPVMVRLTPDLLAFIDRLREREDPAPSRPEAIRQALQALRTMTDDMRD